MEVLIVLVSLAAAVAFAVVRSVLRLRSEQQYVAKAMALSAEIAAIESRLGK